MFEARILADAGTPGAVVNPRLFGSFVEHLGRCVYGGIHEPGHPTADDLGFRHDVLALVRELGVTTVRYPGGNFVSGYRWEDGVGPREQRPTRLDLAWHSTETNQVGLDEFMTWCRRAEVEPMLAVNLGTRGVAEALDLLEYANHPAGTTLAEARAAHGAPQPHDIRMWCLGNEMDGPWQIGARSAEEYGALAARTAAAMKRFDPTLDLVVCGSSGSGIPTFGSWERTVLTHAYPHVDHISCHAYYQQHDGDLASFLASPVDMDRMIETVTGIADEVGAALGEPRRIQVSFDEWNVWYQDGAASTPPEDWPVAPRLLEDDYDVADAVVVGGLLISLLRHADRVTAACLAQLVNVIAPIRTEPGGAAWRQTIFHPFALTSRLARGRVLSGTVEAPSLPTSRHGEVPAVDAVVVWDHDAGRGVALLVNRSPAAEADVLIDVAGLAGLSVAEAHLLHDADPGARNSAAAPDRVVPQPCAVRPADGGGLSVTLPPVSWAAVGLRR